MNTSDPNATFVHMAPLDAWYSRLQQHVTGLHKGKVHHRNYLEGPTGIPGLSFNYGVGQSDCFAELYIKSTSRNSCDTVFDNIRTHHEAIEKAFEGKLNWDRMAGYPTCRIRYEIRCGYNSPREAWPEIQDALIDAMTRLEKALEQYLREF